MWKKTPNVDSVYNWDYKVSVQLYQHLRQYAFNIDSTLCSDEKTNTDSKRIQNRMFLSFIKNFCHVCLSAVVFYFQTFLQFIFSPSTIAITAANVFIRRTILARRLRASGYLCRGKNITICIYANVALKL